MCSINKICHSFFGNAVVLTYVHNYVAFTKQHIKSQCVWLSQYDLHSHSQQPYLANALLPVCLQPQPQDLGRLFSWLFSCLSQISVLLVVIQPTKVGTLRWPLSANRVTSLSIADFSNLWPAWIWGKWLSDSVLGLWDLSKTLNRMLLPPFS